MPGPAREAWLHWAVKKATTNPAADMLDIEETGRQRFGIFSYSYCYHPPTRLWLEGAGFTIGAHTGGRNSTSLGLSIIAAPGADDMPFLVEDTAWMLRLLIDRGQLKPGQYPTGGHRDLKATECPGAKAYALIPAIRHALAAGTTPEEFTMDAEATAAFKALHKRLESVESKQDRLLADAKTKTTAVGAIRKAVARIEAKIKGA